MEKKLLGVDDKQLEVTVSLRYVTNKITLDHNVIKRIVKEDIRLALSLQLHAPIGAPLTNKVQNEVHVLLFLFWSIWSL